MRHFTSKLAWLLPWGALAVSIPAVSDSDEVALVGLDANQQGVETKISSEEFLNRLSGAVNAVSDSALEILAQRKASAVKPWRVHTVLVGVSADVQIGISSIAKLDVAPRFRLAFSDVGDPALP